MTSRLIGEWAHLNRSERSILPDRLLTKPRYAAGSSFQKWLVVGHEQI